MPSVRSVGAHTHIQTSTRIRIQTYLERRVELVVHEPAPDALPALPRARRVPTLDHEVADVPVFEERGAVDDGRCKGGWVGVCGVFVCMKGIILRYAPVELGPFVRAAGRQRQEILCTFVWSVVNKTRFLFGHSRTYIFRT